MNTAPLRILWFLVVGWWLAPVWLLCALLMCCTVVGIPVGYAMATYTKGLAFGPDL